MKQGRDVKARPLNEFSETETPDDWLSIYSSTRTVEELLGLLHIGARYVEDERVLNIYLAYATEKKEDRIVQKARAMLFHHILPLIIDFSSTEKEPDSDSNTWKIRGCHLEKVFAFFMEPGRFPDQQPFQNDVHKFVEHYAEALKYAAGRQGPRVPVELWKNFQRVLIAALESETGERYDKLVRQVLRNGGEPVRSSFGHVLRNSLRKNIDEGNGVSGFTCSTIEELCRVAIEQGGSVRRKVFLLLDIDSERPYLSI